MGKSLREILGSEQQLLEVHEFRPGSPSGASYNHDPIRLAGMLSRVPMGRLVGVSFPAGNMTADYLQNGAHPPSELDEEDLRHLGEIGKAGTSIFRYIDGEQKPQTLLFLRGLGGRMANGNGVNHYATLLFLDGEDIGGLASIIHHFFEKERKFVIDVMAPAGGPISWLAGNKESAEYGQALALMKDHGVIGRRYAPGNVEDIGIDRFQGLRIRHY